LPRSSSPALPIAVGQAAIVEGLDFSVPSILGRGELELIVESVRPGNLEVRFTEVDGQRYAVHAHLETPSGHLETEPLVIVGGLQRTVIRLHPDEPRTLH
jgi:hypothetical protein